MQFGNSRASNSRPARDLEALQMGAAQHSRSIAEHQAMSPTGGPPDKANQAQMSAMMDVQKIIAMQQSNWEAQSHDGQISRPGSGGQMSGAGSRPSSAAARSPHPQLVATPRPMSRNDQHAIGSPLVGGHGLGVGQGDTRPMAGRPGGLRRMASTSQANLVGSPKPSAIGAGSLPPSPAMGQPRPGSALGAAPPPPSSLPTNEPTPLPPTSIPVPALNVPESTPLYKPDHFGLAITNVDDPSGGLGVSDAAPASSAPNPVASIPVHAPVVNENVPAIAGAPSAPSAPPSGADDIATLAGVGAAGDSNANDDLTELEFDLDEFMRTHGGSEHW